MLVDHLARPDGIELFLSNAISSARVAISAGAGVFLERSVEQTFC